jgi:opacity protein-like surface antigen
MKRFIIGMLISVSLILPIAHAEAKDSSVYYGIGLGLAKFEGDTIEGIEFVPGQELKDRTEAYSLFFGYQVNKYLSFEFGYVDFGQVSERFMLDPDIVFIVAPNDILTIDSNGFTIESLFEYPMIERFSVFGLLGFSYLDVDREVSGGFNPETGALAYSSSNTEESVFYGLGLKKRLSDHFDIRLQWKHYDMGVTEADVAGITLEYRF